MKKFFKIAAIGFVILLFVLLIAPFFINVESFRPQIETKIGQALNSNVKVGKLGLSLLPSLTVSTENLQIVPKDPRFAEPIVKCSDFKLSVPLLSLFFSPSVTLKLVKPEITVFEKDGKYNFETLFTKSDSAPEATSEKTTESSSSFLTSKIESARVTVDITKAQIHFRGEQGKATLGIDELLLKNLGLNAPVELKLLSNVSFEGEAGKFSGPFEMKGKVETEKDGDAMAAKFFLEGDFSRMLLKAGSSFNKPEKTPLRFQLTGQFKKAAHLDVSISDLKFELASFVLAGKMQANSLDNREIATIDLNIKNQSSKIEDLAGLSPLLSDYKLQGNLGFFAKAKGSLKNPDLNIEVNADDLKGQTPKLSLPIKQLKAKLKVTGNLENPIVELDPADLFVGSSDVRVRMKAFGMKAPNVNLSISSKSLDLAFLTSGKESAANEGAAVAATKGKALDASLDEMAPNLEKSLRNSMLDKAKLIFTVDIDELKLQGARLQNVKFKSDYAGRVFRIQEGSFAGYGGAVNLAGLSRLNPEAPTYDYTLKLSAIDLAKAIAAHAPAWKGQLSGTLKGESKIQGEGLRKTQLSKNLRGYLKGDIVKGTTSLQLSKIVSLIMKQLPQKPDLKAKASDDKLKGKFKTLKIDSKIVGRVIQLANLDIVYEPDEYNMGDMRFKADGTLNFDKQLNLTGNVFLSPKTINWPEAVGKSGQIEIPVKVSGPMDDAKPDYSYTLSKMGSQLLKKTAEKQVKKGIEKFLKSKKPEDFLKGLFK